MRRLALLGLAASLVGCRALGPDYRPPVAPAATDLRSGSAPAPAVSLPIPPAERWWSDLRAPELETFLDEVAGQNLQLAATLSRLNEARARLGLARAEGSVTATASGSARLAGESSERTLPVPGRPVRYRDAGDSYRIAFDASWEIDLWGRVRRLRESAEASFAAQEADVRALRLSLTTEAASAWITRQGLNRERAILTETVAAREDQATLLKAREASGLAGALDAEKAAAEAALARADLTELERRIQSVDTALGFLRGSGPVAAAPEPAVPLRLPVPGELPSALLLRRPDVEAAERVLAARTAEIGVARAAFFPQFRLTGAAGVESADLGALFDRPSQFWSFGPGVSYVLLDGGRNHRNLEAAQARAEAAHRDYALRLLTAFREAADGLNDRAQQEKTVAALASAEQHASAALELARSRYQSGLAPYFEVLDAQRTALSAQRARLQAETQLSLAEMRLLKALGGRWH